MKRIKLILKNKTNQRSSANSLKESELAKKIVYKWDEASSEVRQAYKQFIGGVVELTGGEVVSQEFREVALTVCRNFYERAKEDEDYGRIREHKVELERLLGHSVSDASLQKVSSLARRLSSLQPNHLEAMLHPENEVNGTGDDMEFGADLDFRPPARFLVDVSLEDGEFLVEESTVHSSPIPQEWYERDDYRNSHPAGGGGGTFDLSWLRDACDTIVRGSSSELPRDELAMEICRVLDSEKPGDEIAGDLLDLVGDGAIETVQDLITHRKELVDAFHHGMFVLKADQTATGSQMRMPSYGTQVTVQTESERQIDKLRRKEERKHRRGIDHGNDHELSAMSFSSLLQASGKKSPFDNLIGTGGGLDTLAATALPQGTVKKHHKGYEEVTIPQHQQHQ